MSEEQLPPRQRFYNSLFEKFREIRPLFTSDTPDPANRIFQKLFIIDTTLTDPDAFEAGLSIWLENQDVDKFLDSFVVVKEGEGHTVKLKNDPTDNA